MFAGTVDRLDEVFLKVEDLEAMRAFYRDVLGFEEDFYDAGWGVGLKMDGASLVLTAADSAASGVSLVFACGDIDRSLRAVSRSWGCRDPSAVARPLGREDSRFRGPRGQHHLPRTAKRQSSVIIGNCSDSEGRKVTLTSILSSSRERRGRSPIKTEQLRS